MERIDPLLVGPDASFDQATLRLHVARYEFAARFAAGRTAVDCACGTGYGSAILADAGARAVTGVDLSDEAVAYARAHHARPAARFVVADAMTWAPDAAPDLWVSLETIEHLPDPAAYVRAVARRLVPGGLLVASVPTTVSTDGNPYHLTDFTPRSWHALLAGAGFRVEEEVRQVQRFTLGDVFGGGRGARQRAERSLAGFYLRHPGVAVARAALTLTRGLVNEYSVVAARRAG